MGPDPVVRFDGVSKTYQSPAVEGLSFEVQPGRVVGLLGRNGAGKTTSLRVLLGLVRPTSGSATVFGQAYPDLRDAANRVGVSLDTLGSITGATGQAELRIWARMLGLPRRRVDDVIERVDLGDAAGRQVKTYSTGMKQRLALATALLPDPELLILDEPVNGLDPDGIRWLRQMLRTFASEGRTVLLSSHLLAEVEQSVDDVVIIQRTLRYAGPLDDLTQQGTHRLEDRFFDLVGSPRGEDAR